MPRPFRLGSCGWTRVDRHRSEPKRRFRTGGIFTHPDWEDRTCTSRASFDACNTASEKSFRDSSLRTTPWRCPRMSDGRPLSAERNTHRASKAASKYEEILHMTVVGAFSSENLDEQAATRSARNPRFCLANGPSFSPFPPSFPALRTGKIDAMMGLERSSMDARSSDSRRSLTTSMTGALPSLVICYRYYDFVI